jgi:acetyl esterase/lipase
MRTSNRAPRLTLLAAFVVGTVVGSALRASAQQVPKRPSAPAAPRTLMTPQDLDALPRRAPDRHIAYGKDPEQYGELRVPSGPGPHPLAILVHGGCFKAAYAKADYMAPIADALKDEGIASWNIEYRRLGDSGGGWPGTYRDVGGAVDFLRTLATPYHLDLSRVVVVGHSAGGHLAMWAAGRARVPSQSAVYMSNPLPVRGAVDLAGPLDMSAHIAEYEGLCRDSVITSLLGGTPATHPDRYAQASPIKLLPYGLPQVVVVGTYEEFVPMPLVRSYADAARRAGDSVRVILVPSAGHFEIASPRSFAWPPVRRAIRALLDGHLPRVEPDSVR